MTRWTGKQKLDDGREVTIHDGSIRLHEAGWYAPSGGRNTDWVDVPVEERRAAAAAILGVPAGHVHVGDPEIGVWVRRDDVRTAAVLAAAAAAVLHPIYDRFHAALEEQESSS